MGKTHFTNGWLPWSDGDILLRLRLCLVSELDYSVFGLEIEESSPGNCFEIGEVEAVSIFIFDQPIARAK